MVCFLTYFRCRPKIWCFPTVKMLSTKMNLLYRSAISLFSLVLPGKFTYHISFGLTGPFLVTISFELMRYKPIKWMSIVKMPSYDISHIQKWKKKFMHLVRNKNQICCKAIWLRRITGPVLDRKGFFIILCVLILRWLSSLLMITMSVVWSNRARNRHAQTMNYKS